MSRSLLRQAEAHIGPHSETLETDTEASPIIPGLIETLIDAKETRGPHTGSRVATDLGNDKRTSEIPAEACQICVGRVLRNLLGQRRHWPTR